MLNGYDDIDYLMNMKDSIQEFAKKTPLIKFNSSLKNKMKKRPVEIMDTTLRDGEQTSGMSFSASEKLTISKLIT